MTEVPYNTIPAAALASYLGNFRKADEQERGFYSMWGPAFEGDFSELDDVTLVFGSLAISIRAQLEAFSRLAADFSQFFAILAVAEDGELRRELEILGRDVYSMAQERYQAQARAFDKVGRKFGKTKFAKGLEDRFILPWDKLDQIKEQARKANAIAVQAEREAVPDSENDAGDGEDGGSGSTDETDGGGTEGAGPPDD